MTISFLPSNSFVLPTPLTPTLLVLGLDDKTASTVSKVYHSAALTLKEACEKEYNHACSAIIATSKDRGQSSKELRSKLLTVAITRYTQAVSKWREEAISKSEASLSKRKKQPTPRSKVKCTTPPPKQSSEDASKSSKSTHVTKNTSLSIGSPPHAFPRAYPPPVRPESILFVTHIPSSEKRRPRCDTKATSPNGLDACIDALSRLSLGPPSPRKSPPKPSKTPKSRSHALTTSKHKPTFQPSPSRPRLVSPLLDTSLAVSERSPTKSAPSRPSLTIPPTNNIEIPRSNRRKACSIPYRRPTTHQSTSPESQESSYFSRTIRRTPSLVSDHGSEASSPSTPPDFPSIPIPPTLARKDLFPEELSLEQFLTPYPEPGWQDIDFGTDLYG